MRKLAILWILVLFAIPHLTLSQTNDKTEEEKWKKTML